MLHERLLYQIYKQALQKNEVTVLKLKPPLLIELSSAESDFFKKFLDFFAKSGFETNYFGGNTFSVSTKPEIFFPAKVKNVFKEFLNRASSDFKEDGESKILTHISYAVALHGASKSSQELAKTEMECLLALWEEFGCPKISLNRKPMLIELSDQELESHLNL